ncbi:hypothetical protein MOQ_003633 [Trypanosoma cruzi marinkellei]|uniref:Uncharacterized protein n=1 Tax=Trypanosoma cruzi marinkellei TaxID=85056 RepID=K2NCD1_TRYCR|nr:hypothetical protein MOQ_003633 [Trypanosoma cruzi marinkellei]
MRVSRVYAMCGASSICRRPSWTQPRQGIPPSVANVLTQSERDTVGVELHLPSFASVAFAGRDEMRHNVRRTVAAVESVIHACADAALPLDYITLRCCAPFSEGESWTEEEWKLALSFLRDLAMQLLPMFSVSLLFPITASNTLPASCISNMFDMLHRVGWKNLLVGLPPSTSSAVLGATAEGAEAPVHPAVRGWISLLHGTGGDHHFSRSQPIPWTGLFPWILQEGFLDRFSVGLSVDLYTSLQSLSLLKETDDESGGANRFSSSSRRNRKELESSFTREQLLKFRQTTRKEEDLSWNQQEKAQQQLRTQSCQGSKGPELITLSTPPREFSDMLLSQHQSFLDAEKSDVGQEILMMAQFLQQASEEHAPKQEDRLQKRRTTLVEYEVDVVHGKKGTSEVAVGRQVGKCSLYWQLLEEIAQRTRAQYMCTTPCVNPASLQAWKQACVEEFACNNKGVNNQGDDSFLAFLPVVHTLWPLLHPVQVERVRRQTISSAAIMDDKVLTDALEFLPQETQQALQQALRDIPPLFLQRTLNGAVEPRRETQIHYEAGGVRLSCGNNGRSNAPEILGAGTATHQTLFSDMPAGVLHHICDVEKTFRQGPMKKTLETSIETLRAGGVHASKCHFLISVPCDTGLPVLTESLRLLCP